MNRTSRALILSAAVLALLSSAAPALLAQEAAVSTVAGVAGSDGISDGVGAAAKFKYPHGVGTDLAGILYVIDTANNTVRRITPDAAVVTLAGLPRVGPEDVDGVGFDARFDTPTGVAVDVDGIVFVGDYGNSKIRRVDTRDCAGADCLGAGVVTSWAGDGNRGFRDGAGLAASFNFLQGVVFDLAGNMYVADRRNFAIRKVTPGAVVTTLAGLPVRGAADGTGPEARFNLPVAVAVDAVGNVYVADKDNHAIRKITPEGVVTTFAGKLGTPGYLDATGGAARFTNPEGVTVGNDGYIYVLDTGNHLLRRITTSGIVTTLAGARGEFGAVDGSGGAARFFFPTAITTAPDGSFYIGDTNNHLVRKATVAAIEYDAALVLPGQARALGTGAYFRSTTWLTNVATVTVPVRLRYLPAAGQGLGGAVTSRSFAIPPRGSVSFADMLRQAFGARDVTNGVVIVEVQHGLPAPVVTSRTFNDAGALGTYGQYIEAVPAGVGAGEQWLYGLAGGTARRSNVGVVNLGQSALTARLALFNPAGQQVGQEITLSVPAGSVAQVNAIDQAFGVPGMALYSIRVRSTSGQIYAYASKLDNATSDPIFIPGTLAAANEQWLDGMASAQGIGTYFRSELVLANPAAVPVVAILEFTRRGSVEGQVTAEVTLAAGETRLWNDAVSEIFGLTGAAGWVRVSAGGTGVVAWARTYSDRGAAGTFGQFIPGFARSATIPTTGALIQGVSENAAFRSNAGLLNVADTGIVQAEVSLRNPQGVLLARKTYTLGPEESAFVQQIVRDMGVTEVTNGYLEVVPSIPDALYMWVSSVDNISTDQIFIRPIPLPSP